MINSIVSSIIGSAKPEESDDRQLLNLWYVSRRVLVMGNPFKNDALNGIRSYLLAKHENHFKIFNLANEDELNIEQDLENVENFPFNANNPCSLSTLIKICSTMEIYLNLSPENVAVLHCKTGLCIFRFLL